MKVNAWRIKRALGFCVLFCLASSQTWALDDSPVQTRSLQQLVASDEPSIIAGKLSFAARDDNGTWLEKRGSTNRTSAADPDKKSTSVESKSHKSDSSATPDLLLPSILPFVDIEADKSSREFFLGDSNVAAVWKFIRLPAKLAESEKIRFQITGSVFPIIKRFDGNVDLRLTFFNRTRFKESRMKEYESARESKPDSAKELAREFGIYEFKCALTNKFEKKPFEIMVPSAILDGIDNGILEVRMECKTKDVYLGFKPDDFVIIAKPKRSNDRGE